MHADKSYLYDYRCPISAERSYFSLGFSIYLYSLGDIE